MLFKLISHLIKNNHPFIIQIRWQFHNYVHDLYQREKQQSYDVWLEYIKEYCPWTLGKFIRILFSNKLFRENVKGFLRKQLDLVAKSRYDLLSETYSDAYLFLDVEVFDKYETEDWAQAMFLCHLHNDIYWTNNPKRAANMMEQSLVELQNEILNKKGFLIFDESEFQRSLND